MMWLVSASAGCCYLGWGPVFCELEGMAGWEQIEEALREQKWSEAEQPTWGSGGHCDL